MGKLSKVAGTVGVVAGTAYLSKSKNRKKVKDQMTKAINTFNKNYFKELAKPSDIDDSDMVDEGALTSVQYYNRLQQESMKNKNNTF